MPGTGFLTTTMLPLPCTPAFPRETEREKQPTLLLPWHLSASHSPGRPTLALPGGLLEREAEAGVQQGSPRYWALFSQDGQLVLLSQVPST